LFLLSHVRVQIVFCRLPPVRRPSTRDRPAKAPLSVEVVVDAALAILQSDGLEAVTMRRVAAALDTGPASLYVYISGSEGLLQALLDRVIATIELGPPDRHSSRSAIAVADWRLPGDLCARVELSV
jgi:AcrR family transcriptional regulator